MKELTRQENRITHLIANGVIMKEIAGQLFISPATANTHYRNIRKKIKAHNIADITRKYILSLPKAADVLKATLFLVIQFYIMLSVVDIDLRKAKKIRMPKASITNTRKI